MANQVAKIPVLEKIIKDRHLNTKQGKVEIGVFWSILRIYYCMKIGISPATLCSIASMIDGRLDHNYLPDDSDIRPATLRKWLRLESVPKNAGHTVVTKTVASGNINEEKLKDVLIKYNSYGEDILKDIVNITNKEKGSLLSTKAKTIGVGDFNAVLTIANIIINEVDKDEFEQLAPEDHKNFLIKTINEAGNKHINIAIPV